MQRILVSLLIAFLLPLSAPAAPKKHPKIVVLWKGPVGEAAAQTLLAHLTEQGYPAKIVPFSWKGEADLKLYVKTELKEQKTTITDPRTKQQEKIIVTNTSIDIHAEDKDGFVLLQQHLSHPFAIRIKEGLGEAARNLVKAHLAEFDKKLEMALQNLGG
jgi:hypothetical protein